MTDGEATGAAAAEPAAVPDAPGAGPARRVRRYLPVAVLVAVAAWQMVRVQTEGLSRWKGGGFGMYSTVHHDDFEVWAEWKVPGRLAAYVQVTKPQSVEARAMLSRASLFASPESLAELRTSLPPNASGKLEVWRPRLDPKTMEYRRELVAEQGAPAE